MYLLVNSAWCGLGWLSSALYGGGGSSVPALSGGVRVGVAGSAQGDMDVTDGAVWCVCGGVSTPWRVVYILGVFRPREGCHCVNILRATGSRFASARTVLLERGAEVSLVCNALR